MLERVLLSVVTSIVFVPYEKYKIKVIINIKHTESITVIINNKENKSTNKPRHEITSAER